jgi:hypothetical protein
LAVVRAEGIELTVAISVTTAATTVANELVYGAMVTDGAPTAGTGYTALNLGPTTGREEESNTHYLRQNPNVTAGVSYTFSVHLKAAERGYAIVFADNALPQTAIVVNLSNGTITDTNGSPIGAQVVDAGNGWYRASFGVTAASTGASDLIVMIAQDGLFADRFTTGDGASGILLWGWQFEVGTGSQFPTPYLPTTGATASRPVVQPSSYGQMGYGVGNGGYGSLALPGQVFMIVTRSAPSGVANIAGYGNYPGGYIGSDTVSGQTSVAGNLEYIDSGSLPPPCLVRADRQDTSRHIQYGAHIWSTI